MPVKHVVITRQNGSDAVQNAVPGTPSQKNSRRRHVRRGSRGLATAQLPLPLTEIARSGEERLLTGIGELDRVLGGGLVRGSLVLIGGDPGIGKSTLLLQATAGLSYGRTAEQHPVLYVSGEESASQLRMRGDRLGVQQSTRLHSH